MSNGPGKCAPTTTNGVRTEILSKSLTLTLLVLLPPSRPLSQRRKPMTQSRSSKSMVCLQAALLLQAITLLQRPSVPLLSSVRPHNSQDRFSR